MGLIALILAIIASAVVVASKMLPASLVIMVVPLLLGIWAVIKKSKKILGIIALVVSTLVLVATPFLFSQKAPSAVKNEVKKKAHLFSSREREEKPQEQSGQPQGTGRVKLENQNDKTILLVDLSNTNPQEVQETIDEIDKSLQGQPKKSILMATDISNASVSAQTLKKARQVALKNGQNLERVAIIGASTSRRILLRSAAMSARVSNRVAFFDDPVKAKEWLGAAEVGKAGSL